MKERPILFSTPMVQAILQGRKTQTRRIVNPQPLTGMTHVAGNLWRPLEQPPSLNGKLLGCQYGKRGDILWVRETWGKAQSNYAHSDTYLYKADDYPDDFSPVAKWKPSIHMPKEAARIFLKIIDVRVERLQEISQEDAISEGIEFKIDETSVSLNSYKIYEANNWWDENPIQSFKSLWESINGQESWNKNPWVWVIEFEILHN
jgi:hypothetical protein